MLRSTFPAMTRGAIVARTSAERMAALRVRQHRAGLTSLTLVVPRGDAALLRDLARRRRTRLERVDPRRRAGDVAGPVAGLPTKRSAISSRDIRRLRELLEITAVGLVVERMNARLARRIERALALDAKLDSEATPAQLQRFHIALAEFTGDETLQFLLRIALSVTAERSSFAARSRAERNAVVVRMHRSHARIARALIGRDTPAAERAVRRYFAELEGWLD
jgi:DNA-binding FadR family transcriptional regulator